jgi:hypothetical protein
VLGCLAWGALAALMVSQHALAAHDVSANDEALSLDTLNLISRTGDANFQKDFSAAQSKLSTLLSSASAQSVLALLMAVGCAWGLTVRLTEYR